MSFSTVRWITFDAGGTLLFPHPSVGEIYAEILSWHGQERDPKFLQESFMKVWKKDVRECMPTVTAESEKERWRGVISKAFADLAHLVDLDHLFDDLWVAFCEAERWRLPYQTKETLTELRSRGYRLAMLSNWDERLRPLLKGIKLEAYFEEIFVSCEIGYEKPDPRIFAAVEEKLQANGEEILHIGDSHHHDVLGAGACGWRTVHAFGETLPASDSVRVTCLTELLDLLPAKIGTES